MTFFASNIINIAYIRFTPKIKATVLEISENIFFNKIVSFRGDILFYHKKLRISIDDDMRSASLEICTMRLTENSTQYTFWDG